MAREHLADFSACQSPQFLRDVAERNPQGSVIGGRIKTFGHGMRVEVMPEVALDMAITAELQLLGGWDTVISPGISRGADSESCARRLWLGPRHRAPQARR